MAVHSTKKSIIWPSNHATLLTTEDFLITFNLDNKGGRLGPKVHFKYCLMKIKELLPISFFFAQRLQQIILHLIPDKSIFNQQILLNIGVLNLVILRGRSQFTFTVFCTFLTTYLPLVYNSLLLAYHPPTVNVYIMT